MEKAIMNLKMGEEYIQMISNGELRIVRVPAGFIYISIIRFDAVGGVPSKAISSCFVSDHEILWKRK